jgi:hypothetical protein
MRLFLASLLEPENFGPGRVISIATGKKPENINVNIKFDELIPDKKIVNKYYSTSRKKAKAASGSFIEDFTAQLSSFKNEVLALAKDQDKKPTDILPFKEGDTLVSWERKAFTNYRVLIAPILTELGFDVVIN